MLERVRDKHAKRKAEEDLTMPKPIKAVCEREERIVEVQLKAFWACFPPVTSATDGSCRSEATKSLGEPKQLRPRSDVAKGVSNCLRVSGPASSKMTKSKLKEGKSMRC